MLTAVHEQKVDGELRVKPQEFRQQRRDHQPADQGRRADPNPLRRRTTVARQTRFDLPELTKDRFGALIEDTPILRECELARRSQQQWRAEMLLQRRDLPADRGQRTRQRSGCCRQAAGVDNPHKRGHGGELIQFPSFRLSQ
jgi:hypothetical protein